MQSPSIDEILGTRFRVEKAPTALARIKPGAPIAFTRLRHGPISRGLSMSVPPEESFAFQVFLKPRLPSELWIDGKYRKLQAAESGDVLLFDLSRNPVVSLDAAFDTMRCYISVATLDELAYERGIPCVGGLNSKEPTRKDPVLHGLAITMAAALDSDGAISALFTDAIALAFHAHVISAYSGRPSVNDTAQGGLAPWQLRRTQAFIEANLDGDPSVAELAKECGLSASHFARAFRQSAGMPPHQWLTKRRVERAKDLLLRGRLELAEIALACGFVDQSHFTRAFSKAEGHSPGKWKRIRMN